MKKFITNGIITKKIDINDSFYSLDINNIDI